MVPAVGALPPPWTAGDHPTAALGALRILSVCPVHAVWAETVELLAVEHAGSVHATATITRQAIIGRYEPPASAVRALVSGDGSRDVFSTAVTDPARMIGRAHVEPADWEVSSFPVAASASRSKSNTSSRPSSSIFWMS